MNNVIDLAKERRIRALINRLGQLISSNPDTTKRTFEYLENDTMTDTEKTRTVSVRFPIELLNWIDSYSRIVAVNQESRVTRNMVIINFLQQMKALIEHRERTEWGRSHIEEIEAVLNEVRKQGEDNETQV